MTEKGWRETNPGGLVLEPGNSIAYETGSWRSRRPVVDATKCVRCLDCWIFCPDGSIILGEGSIDIDLKHCKGCGICAQECPQGAITMVEEEVS